MSEENLFAGETTPNPGESAPTTPSIPDNVKDLIGEGKKYASVEKALEALGHSQAHIAKIEAENAQLRDTANGAIDTQKLYETVQELLQNNRQTNGNVVDVNALESLLDRKLTEKEQKAQADRNAQSVRDALTAKFGSKEKAQEMFDAKAKELGVGSGFLTDLAKKSPKAVLEYFGGVSATPPPTKGGLNSEQLSNQHRDPPHKSIMGGATSAEMIAAFKAAAPKTS